MKFSRAAVKNQNARFLPDVEAGHQNRNICSDICQVWGEKICLNRPGSPRRSSPAGGSLAEVPGAAVLPRTTWLGCAKSRPWFWPRGVNSLSRHRPQLTSAGYSENFDCSSSIWAQKATQQQNPQHRGKAHAQVQASTSKLQSQGAASSLKRDQATANGTGRRRGPTAVNHLPG